MDDEWVLFFRDNAGRDERVASASKQVALIQARDLMRQHYVVHKIEPGRSPRRRRPPLQRSWTLGERTLAVEKLASSVDVAALSRQLS